MEGSVRKRQREISKLEGQAPHQQDGKRIVQGMLKAGDQSHIHIIVSRKDASNSVSLSPGSKYKASEVVMNGKTVKRGFDRDRFFENAEKTFDKTFAYLMSLPVSEKAIAFKLMREAGIPLMPSIPVKQGQIALKLFNKLRKGLDIAVKSSSIGI